MATALRLDDGRHEIALPDGTLLRTALSPERLQAAGYDIRAPERAAMTAYNDGAGGVGNVPDSRTDVPDEVPGAGGVGGAPPAAMDGSEGAPASPVQQPTNPPSRASETPPKDVRRFGASVERVDVPTVSAGGSTPPAPRPSLVRANQNKGVDIRTGYTKQSSAASGMLPEAELAESDARIQRKLAEQQMGDVKAEQFGNEMGLAGQEERYQRERRAELERRQASMQAAQQDYQARQAQLDRESDAVSKLEVDPNRYFSKMGTGGRILAAIGMLAGGVTAGLHGGPNHAQEFLYRAMRDDIEDQKQRIALRRQGVATKQTQLDKLTAILHGDQELAERQLEANHAAYAAALVRKYAAETGVKNINPQLLAFGAQLDQEAAEGRLKNAAQFGDRIAEQYQWVPDRYVGGAPAVKESDVRDVAKDLAANGVVDLEAKAGALKDLLDQLPPDADVPTPDTRNVISRGIRSAADYVGGTGSGAALLDTPEQRAAAAKLARVKGSIRHELSGVAVSPSEQKAIDDQLDQINTPDGLRTFTQEKMRDLVRRRAATVAGDKPEAVRVYDARKGAYGLPARSAGLRSEQ